MSSQPETIKALIDLLENDPDVSYRRMFGEYALYHGVKVVALVCEDQLFIKPTTAGEKLIKEITLEPPYPGAKPWFLIHEDQWEGDYLKDLLYTTAEELPIPKPKKKKL